MTTETSLQIVYQRLEDLIPYVGNSRTHSDAQVAQIAASIREFGWTSPILVDDDGGIIAGHGRLLAARKLDMVEVPCILLLGLTSAQKKALVIADNKLALNAGWDNDLLRIELEALTEEEFDLSLLGFDDSELAALMADETPGTEGNTDPDEVPEVQAEVVSRTGDVWRLGGHRVMCGDSVVIG